MNAAQRHWQRELNTLLHAQNEAEDKGLKLGKKHYARVKFVASCIAAHTEDPVELGRALAVVVYADDVATNAD